MCFVEKGLTPLVRLEYRTAVKEDHDGSGVIKGLQPSHALWSAHHETATPSWVELGLRGRSCLWGPSQTILGTTLFGVAGVGAIAQRGSAGRAARIGEPLYTLREKQVVSIRWRRGGPQAGRHPVKDERRGES